MSSLSKDFSFVAVCLAAGKGLRMGTAGSKVLQKSCAWPLLRHVLTNVASTQHCSSIYTVLSPEMPDSFPWESSLSVPVKKIVQKEAKGTAHALQLACASMEEEKKLPVLVISGDSPLYEAEKIISLLSYYQNTGSEMSLASATLEDPHGYGRVILDGSRLLRIVEEKDASAEERAIRLVNGGLYVLAPSAIASSLDSIEPSPETGEYYLTSIVDSLLRKGSFVNALRFSSEHVLGVNTPWELSRVGMYLHRRIAKKWAQRGVNFFDPYHTYIDMDVEIEKGTTLEPNVYLYGKTKISEKAYIESGSRLENVVLGKKSHIFANSYLQDCTVGEETCIGPMARLRPGTNVGNRVRIGNFVEIKKSQLGEGTKISHLSYVGDAKLGKEVNIGCGFITCNYDGGKEKHETNIGNGAFIGSDVQAVAPIHIGANSYIASGSTLTKDVPEGRQKNKNNYGKKLLASRGKELQAD